MKQFFKTHFLSELLQATGEESTSETSTTEIFNKNQILISKETSPDQEKSKQANTKEIDFLPGENTAVSEDGNSITSLVTGYPFIKRKQDGRTLSVKINMVPLVHIQADKMKAFLTLYPAISGKQLLKPEELELLLKEEGISYGIDRTLLNESLQKLANLNTPLKSIPFARGILPIDGKGAYLRFLMEIGPLPGTILRDGTIDYRDRKIFIGVDENQVIAVRVPSTSGSPGINVLGEAIPQQPGKDITIKVSGDAAFSPETGKIIATGAGILSTVKGSEVKVSAKQVISGDVDFSTGNLESKNSVDIKGNVQPGFSVKTKGDLRVGGNIEGAAILSKGNVVVNGGILGANSRLETEGDADINFAERTEVIAGGKIVIRKGAYYTTVTGDDDIFCSPESKIVGSVICCAGNFVGGDVGSHHGQAASIAAGVDGKRYLKYKSLKQQVLDIEHKLEILRTRKGKKCAADAIYQQYEAELQQIQAAFRKLNLIPATPAYSRNEPACNTSDAIITIHGMVTSSTKLRIGNLTQTLNDERSAVEFFVDENLGQIVARKL
ncbi:MAG: FapA family protein [Desulforhopalus sp.]